MGYQIRKAQKADLKCIMGIYAQARKFMAEHDNPSQWGNAHPSEEMLRKDISDEKLYVIWDSKGIHGVFYFAIEQDPTYAEIHDGRWNSDRAYGVIHRIAGDGSGGILHTAVAFARKQIGYVRIDTHADNYVMQKALEKQGFFRCGIIHIEDGSPRIAYDSVCGVREAADNDLAEILHLYLHLHESTIPEENEILTSTWKQIVEDPNHHLILYEAEGKIVSSCICVVIPNLTRSVRPYAFVENVVTHREYRGRGYATACLEYAKQIAVGKGCYKIMLMTGTKETDTLNFYQKAGYNRTDKTAFIQWLDK